MKIKIKLHSWERRETLSPMSCDCRTTVARYIFKIRPKFENLVHKCPFNSMRLQRESCVYIVNLCREIVVNNMRISLQLSHSSEIGAFRTQNRENIRKT